MKTRRGEFLPRPPTTSKGGAENESPRSRHRGGHRRRGWCSRRVGQLQREAQCPQYAEKGSGERRLAVRRSHRGYERGGGPVRRHRRPVPRPNAVEDGRAVADLRGGPVQGRRRERADAEADEPRDGASERLHAEGDGKRVGGSRQPPFGSGAEGHRGTHRGKHLEGMERRPKRGPPANRARPLRFQRERGRTPARGGASAVGEAVRHQHAPRHLQHEPRAEERGHAERDEPRRRQDCRRHAVLSRPRGPRQHQPRRFDCRRFYERHHSRSSFRTEVFLWL